MAALPPAKSTGGGWREVGLVTGRRHALALAVLLGATAPLHAAPFSTEGVINDLKPRYPTVARPSDTLPDGVTALENLVYARRGDELLQLDLYRPAGAGPWPAVIVVHGGGWETGDRFMERPFAKQLAARGYVAVPVSYRLGPGGRFPGGLHDLKAAIRWLRANAVRHGIDPARIGAVGGSAGGQLVSLLGASNGVTALEGDAGDLAGVSSDIQAMVNIDGVASFPDAALIAQEEASPGASSRFNGGNYSQARETWHASSALTYVSRRSAPSLFIKSTVTRPILPGRDEMSARLKALGVDSAVVTMADTPHPFWLVHPWFEPTLAHAEAFLRKHLHGGR